MTDIQRKYPINVPLLRRIQEHILEDGRRLAMSEWIQRKTLENQQVHESDCVDNSLFEFAPCGTAACIAGWAQILGNVTNIHNAEILLGIISFKEEGCYDISDKLEFVSNWDKPFCAKYNNAKTPEQCAQVASSYIDYFIEKYADSVTNDAVQQ